jgi:hypothetical protein
MKSKLVFNKALSRAKPAATKLEPFNRFSYDTIEAIKHTPISANIDYIKEKHTIVYTERDVKKALISNSIADYLKALQFCSKSEAKAYLTDGIIKHNTSSMSITDIIQSELTFSLPKGAHIPYSGTNKLWLYNKPRGVSLNRADYRVYS